VQPSPRRHHAAPTPPSLQHSQCWRRRGRAASLAAATAEAAAALKAEEMLDLPKEAADQCPARQDLQRPDIFQTRKRNISGRCRGEGRIDLVQTATRIVPPRANHAPAAPSGRLPMPPPPERETWCRRQGRAPRALGGWAGRRPRAEDLLRPPARSRPTAGTGGSTTHFRD
jgi:hypothetical protein